MEIRPMEWTDYQKVYALWLSCPGMGLNDLDDSLEGIGRFLQRNPETCFVAVEGESIAGCILAGTDGRRAYIYRNQPGNAFWEKMGFTVRTDLTYRNRALTELRRIDT